MPTKTPSIPTKSPSTPIGQLKQQVVIYAEMSRGNFVANLRTFWRTFYRPNKGGGVQKMTNMRYACMINVLYIRCICWSFLHKMYPQRVSQSKCIIPGCS